MSWFSSTKPYLYISTSNVLEMQDSDNACLAAEASCKADGALTLPGGTSGRAFNPMGDSTTQHRHARITPSNQAPLEQPDEPDVLSGSPMPKPDGNRPDETISTATAPTPMLTAEKPNKQVPRGGVQKPANVEPDYSHYDRISADGLKKILKARRISPGYYKPRLYCHDCFVYREEIKEASKKMNLAMKDYQIQDAQRNTSYGISWRRAICAFIEAKGAWYDLALKAKEHATKQCKARPENRVPRNHSREICPMRECDTQERTPPKDSAQSPASTSSSASIGLSPAGRDATAGDIAQAATQQQGPRTFDVGAAVPTQNAIDDNGAASDRMLNGQLGSSWQPRGWQPGDKPPAARAQTAAILKVTTMTPAPSLVAAASTASTAASYQVAAPSAPSNNDGAADTAALANSTSTLPTSTMVDNVLPANEATNADATPANANSAGDSTLPENNTGTPPASSTVDNAASVHITGGAVKTSSASNTSDPPGNDSVGCSTPVKPKPKRATGNPSQQDIEEAFRKKEWRPSSFGRCPHSKRGRRRQQRRNASVFKNMARVPTQQRAHTTLRKRVAALARHVGTNSGAVTGPPWLAPWRQAPCCSHTARDDVSDYLYNFWFSSCSAASNHFYSGSHSVCGAVSEYFYDRWFSDCSATSDYFYDRQCSDCSTASDYFYDSWSSDCSTASDHLYDCWFSDCSVVNNYFYDRWCSSCSAASDQFYSGLHSARNGVSGHLYDRWFSDCSAANDHLYGCWYSDCSTANDYFYDRWFSDCSAASEHFYDGWFSSCSAAYFYDGWSSDCSAASDHFYSGSHSACGAANDYSYDCWFSDCSVASDYFLGCWSSDCSAASNYYYSGLHSDHSTPSDYFYDGSHSARNGVSDYFYDDWFSDCSAASDHLYGCRFSDCSAANDHFYDRWFSDCSAASNYFYDGSHSARNGINDYFYDGWSSDCSTASDHLYDCWFSDCSTASDYFYDN
ncbi:hypothetical protein H4S04_006486 [Coemansia sp. S16]|nr:hypothetical protein H4S04_006486 [Coemansia sp. S16]